MNSSKLFEGGHLVTVFVRIHPTLGLAAWMCEELFEDIVDSSSPLTPWDAVCQCTLLCVWVILMVSQCPIVAATINANEHRAALHNRLWFHIRVSFSFATFPGFEISACPKQAEIASSKLFSSFTCATGKSIKYTVWSKQLYRFCYNKINGSKIAFICFILAQLQYLTLFLVARSSLIAINTS